VWSELANSSAHGAAEVRDESNRTSLTLDLSPWISSGTVFLRFRDPSPQDGWGPLLLQMTLQPAGGDERTPWPPDAPLALRDGYCIAYGKPARGAEVFVAGEGGRAVAFGASSGAGRVMAIGAPPVLFASSKAKSDILRGVYRQLCADAGFRLALDGSLHLVRGRLHIVYPTDKPVSLKGTFLRVLSAEQEIVRDPVVSLRCPELLMDTRSSGTQTGGMGLVFSSARLREEKAAGDKLELVVEGPERIPGAVTVSLGGATSATVAARRVSDGAAVETTATLDGSRGFARVVFPNHPEGVHLRLAPHAR
jgi:hypothetical protein